MGKTLDEDKAQLVAPAIDKAWRPLRDDIADMAMRENQTKVGRLLGVEPGTISRWISSESRKPYKMPLQNFMYYAYRLGFSVSVARTKPAEDDLVSPLLLPEHAPVEPGGDPYERTLAGCSEAATPAVSIRLLREAGREPSSMSALRYFRQRGGHMEPYIHHDALVLVDTGDTAPVVDSIFAVWAWGDIILRRVQRSRTGSILFVKDQGAQPDEIEFSPDHAVAPIGRALWASHSL